MLSIKHSVSIAGLKPEAMLGIVIVHEAYKDLGKEFVLTSVVDGTHSKRSHHYKGMAFDCRTRHLSALDLVDLADTCQQRLGQDFQVVLESTHLHVEYDPLRLQGR